MDRDMITLITLLSMPVAAVIAMVIKGQCTETEAKRIKLKEVEQLIKHVKSMTVPKAIVKPPSLEKSIPVPQAKRRGRPSKAVAV